MNEYRLTPLEGDSHGKGSGCTAETFMKAYGTMMGIDDKDDMFQDFMAEWQKEATQTYLMMPSSMVNSGTRPRDIVDIAGKRELKIVLVFPDLSVAVCGDNGGVATDVPSMMSDWWKTGKAVFDKHLRETNPNAN